METGDRFQLQKPIFNFTSGQGRSGRHVPDHRRQHRSIRHHQRYVRPWRQMSTSSPSTPAWQTPCPPCSADRPISVVISPSAAAPHPVVSAVILMAIMMVILLSRQLPKIIRLLPEGSVAGVLFVLGSFMTLPENLSIAFSGRSRDALACSVTLAVTAVCDPFVGMIAGMVVRVIAAPLGLA